ncbi:MAG: TolC family protein [Pseudomonadota bacterium]
MRNRLVAVTAALLLGGCAVLPEPLSEVEVASLAAEVDADVVSGQEEVNHRVTLYEAMSRAIRYNLDSRVEARQQALRERQLAVAHHGMLPKLVADSGYANRNNNSGGSSRRLPIGTGPIQADTPSTSSERGVASADLELSWNILDFGLSYIRAQQAADKVLIARENQRKVVHRIVEDVRTAYWRAVTAERLVGRLRELEGRVGRALRDTRSLAQDGDASPLTALTFERELVEIKTEIQRLTDDLAAARIQLAALMNVRPGKHFHVVIPYAQRPPPFVGLNAEGMVTHALERRPELLEVAYEKRINRKEARAAILELLPSVGASAGAHWNSNAFLFNQHHLAWGTQATWNLLKVFSYRDREAEIAARDDLLRVRGLAVTMAVMTQVHVARVRLIHTRRRFATARHYMNVQNRILGQIRSSLAAGKVSEQTAIREEMNTLIARVKLDLAYVDLQNAYGATFAAMGINPFANVDVDHGSLDQLAGSLREGWNGLGAVAALKPMRAQSVDLVADAADAVGTATDEPGEAAQAMSAFGALLAGSEGVSSPVTTVAFRASEAR